MLDALVGHVSKVPAGAARDKWALKRRRRSAFATTETLEKAIAAPAITGFSRPAAASGSGRDVVAERPEQVLLDRPQRRAAEADGVGGGAQVAGDERQVRGLDRHVGAGADGQAEVGLRERGRVVDAVADHRHDAALGLQPLDDRRPCRTGSTSAITSSMPTSAATARAVVSLSPVSSTGRRPSALERGDGLRRRRLDGVGDDEHGARPGRPSRRRSRSGRAASAARRAASSSAGRSMAQSASSAGRPSDEAWPSTTPSTPRPSRLPKPRRRAAAELGPRGAGDGLGDRVLGGVLERARRAAAPRRGRRRRRRATSTSAILPVVTVPVLSSTIVSTWRVDSSTSGPLISRPSCAPRPVPTISAVGVARPSAHGQAMISTATAAVNANVALSPAPSQKPERGDGERDDDRHEHAGDAVGEPLDRRLAGLRVGDERARSARARCRRRPWSRARPAARRR